MIKEVIVVEGRDDVIRVKEAVEAEVISTHGWGFGKRFLSELKAMQKERGIIILTDPDTAGRRIRERISKEIPEAKQAYISKSHTFKDGDIGIENADPSVIRKAIEAAKPLLIESNTLYEMTDLIELGLAGGEGAAKKRERLSEILHLGHVNAKELLKRLNGFQIPRKTFIEAVEKINLL